MQLLFLGTSHGKQEKDRYHTCTVLTANGKHYVIDAGAPVFDLFERNDLRFGDIAGIFITHSHIDHIAGLRNSLLVIGQTLAALPFSR